MTDATPTPDPAATPAAPAYAAAPATRWPEADTESCFVHPRHRQRRLQRRTSFCGFGAGIAAIILAARAKKSEPGAPKWMARSASSAALSASFGIIVGI